jgi:hypothetical protein
MLSHNILILHLNSEVSAPVKYLYNYMLDTPTFIIDRDTSNIVYLNKSKKKYSYNNYKSNKK